jgi:hypothetical protein
MAIAMTEGATKIKLLQESALASLPEKNSADPQLKGVEGIAPKSGEGCLT